MGEQRASLLGNQRLACFYFLHKAFLYFVEEERGLLDKQFMQTVWLVFLKAELREIEHFLAIEDDQNAFKVTESIKEQITQLTSADLLCKPH